MQSDERFPYESSWKSSYKYFTKVAMPPLPKRRGQGEPWFPQRCRGKPLPAARTRQHLIPHQSPAPPDFDTTASGHRVPSLVCRADERGVSKKVSTELFSYIGGTASPLYSGNLSCQKDNARYGRSRRPRAATDAPRRRCGSCPTGRPADDGCPMRSSRSNPERLPESASCR